MRERSETSRTGTGALRGLLVVVLVLAGFVGTAASPVAWWTRGLVRDSDRYVRAVAPLASNTALRATVSKAVTSKVTAGLDLGSVTGAQLPPALLLLLAGNKTVGQVLDAEIAKVVTAEVDSPAFTTLWSQLNRTAHPQVAELLTGSGSGGSTVRLSGGSVVLDTGVFVRAVRAQLLGAGLGLASRIPGTGATVVLGRVDHLTRVQRVVRLLDRYAPALPWASGACFLLAVAVARRRGRALVAVGLSVIVAMAGLTAVRHFGATFVANRVSIPSTVAAPREVAADAFTTVTRSLQPALWLVAAVGIGILVLGLLTQAIGAGRARRRPRAG